MKNNAFAWSTNLFENYFDHQEQIGNLIHLSVNGISVLIRLPEYLGLALEKGFIKKISSELEQNSHELSHLAISEIDNGFPLLYSQSTISTWDSLENLMKDFLVLWIVHETERIKIESITSKTQKILLAYKNGELEKAFDILATIYKNNHLLGAAKFEKILLDLDIGGKIDSQLENDLLELHQVRNVHVHRQGVADEKFIRNCPTLNLHVGSRVIVSQDMYYRYRKASLLYPGVILQRLQHISKHERANSHK